jgi:transposase
MPPHKTSRREYSEAIKNQLVGYIQANENISQAAKTLGILYSTARDIWAHFKTTSSVQNEHQSGRPRITTEHDNNKLEIDARKARRKPFTVLANEANMQISPDTVA